MKTPLYALTTALVLAAAAPVALSAASEDEAAIRQHCASFVAAWNKHDPKAMAMAWAEDGDLINPFGRVAKGRAEIEKLFTDEHAGVMRGTTYSITEDSIRMLTPNLALCDWASEVTGMHDPDGKALPVFKHHVAMVLEKRNGKWMTLAGRPYAFLPPPGAAAP